MEKGKGKGKGSGEDKGKGQDSGKGKAPAAADAPEAADAERPEDSSSGPYGSSWAPFSSATEMRVREEASWADDEEEARAEAQAVYSDTCGCENCETLREEGYTKARLPTSTRSKRKAARIRSRGTAQTRGR